MTIRKNPHKKISSYLFNKNSLASAVPPLLIEQLTRLHPRLSGGHAGRGRGGGPGVGGAIWRLVVLNKIVYEAK